MPRPIAAAIASCRPQFRLTDTFPARLVAMSQRAADRRQQQRPIDLAGSVCGRCAAAGADERTANVSPGRLSRPCRTSRRFVARAQRVHAHPRAIVDTLLATTCVYQPAVLQPAFDHDSRAATTERPGRTFEEIRHEMEEFMMKRSLFAAALALFVVTPLVAQAPKGWKVRADRSTSATDPDAAGTIKFVTMGTGFHATNPQAAVYWNPANTATGNYTLKGTSR
jgi:hypothetical protein